jgi:hypothetical protein
MGKIQRRKSTSNVKRVMSLMNVLIFVCSLGSLYRPLILGQLLHSVVQREANVGLGLQFYSLRYCDTTYFDIHSLLILPTWCIYSLRLHYSHNKERVFP